ncbi:MAG: TIGR04552 family protein [Polyangiaceae bacterium]
MSIQSVDSEPPRSGERISLIPTSARLKTLDELTLHDTEALGLILRGSSVIDWHRLNFENEEQALAFIRNHELDPDRDAAYIDHVKSEAVNYLRRTFAFAIPKPVENASIVELLLLASAKGHRQMCACTILKTLHIINHMAGRELLFRLPISDRDLFHFIEEKVYRVVGTMLSEGFPITEFVGGRKNLDSTYTKLLSKPEATAAALYDKLRFRIVTRSREDLLPVLEYLTTQIFPFNYVVPGQSTNTIFHFRSFCEQNAHLERWSARLQGGLNDTLTPGDNRFSAPGYRVLHFVTDVPLRVPPHIMEMAPPGSEHLGPIVYMLCEFQLLDSESEGENEASDASHAAYKSRQREAVARRLRLGARARDGRRQP